jgi:hypothetical protein
MTVQRINGCPLDLGKLTDDELFKLGEYIGRNLDQAERELGLVTQEISRRASFKPLQPVA